ncbi:hypothetical protein [Candidatus Mycobacterium methanotrophicum]|uniref:Hemerythrin-like domain-containing protein n=1 Tax=Candidatus Mycobacterium methanotrophicum TaxID=2943498 RepID=A0ABY4QJW2_9MYCO|nr:hypothetical protein [Candidatus Mycobacterium methanotrophicum]UQX10083.1 hypothetical protein M5I08_17970 [Candidatus Mycobacterium methanotrophicum]
MNAYTVLQDHHKVLKGLIKKISNTPAVVPERQAYLDDLLVELDIHFRIEQLRESTVHKLRVKGRKSVLRAL